MACLRPAHLGAMVLRLAYQTQAVLACVQLATIVLLDPTAVRARYAIVTVHWFHIRCWLCLPVCTVYTQACGNASVFCPDGSSVPQVVPNGSYSIGVSPSTRFGTALCAAGLYCAFGVSVSAVRAALCVRCCYCCVKLVLISACRCAVPVRCWHVFF